MTNELVQHITVEESISMQWVSKGPYEERLTHQWIANEIR